MLAKNDELIIKEVVSKLGSKDLLLPVLFFLESGHFPFSILQAGFDFTKPFLFFFLKSDYVDNLSKIFATKENFSFFIKELEN